MKTLFFSFLILISAISYGQFSQGTKEMSLSFSASQHSVKTEGYGSGSDVKMLYLSFMPAYYITQGFAIEPEIALALNNEYRPGQCIIANVCYTAKLENSNAALFIRGGYGLSNGLYYPMLRGLLYPSRKELEIGIINFGTGVKLLIGNSAYLRIEANYKQQSYEQDMPTYTYGYPSYSVSIKKVETKYSDISITAGLGILF